MMRRVSLCLLVGLLVACGSNAAHETTTIPPPTTTTTAVVTTTTVVETTTTTGARRVVVDEGLRVAQRLSLIPGWTYVMVAFDGFSVEIAPPMAEWWLTEYGQSIATLVWEGETGSRPGTLEIAIYGVSLEGVEGAWSRIESLQEEVSRDPEWEWTWVDRGTAMVGDREVEWREVRLPPIPADDPDPDNPTALTIVPSNFPVVLQHDSSARFYVVPVAGLTVTVLGWESRCVCPGRRSLGREDDFVDRDVENELSMWIEELEAFLAHVEFVEP